MVLEVLREEATVNEIAAQHGLNPVMVSRWKTEFLERAARALTFRKPEIQRRVCLSVTLRW